MADNELFGNSEQLDDTISRQAAIDALGERPMVWVGSDYELGARNQYDADVLAIETVPPAQPQPEIKRCKDCKHWRDSDGVYRRGTGAESKCPLNTKEVYAGTFYCGYAERRTDERSD